MKRFVYNQFLKWKNNPRRKPLIVEGARQVGKTLILKEFAKNEYKNFAYLSCENNEQMRNLFAATILKELCVAFPHLQKFKLKNKTLL